MRTKRNIFGLTAAICLCFAAVLLLFDGINIQQTGLGNGASAVYSKELAIFTDTLTETCATDKEKVDAIYTWITDNIEYDINDGTILIQTADPDRIMEEKKALCYGYSALFAAMCRSQGIPCNIVDGVSMTDDSAYHSWNAVTIDGRLYSVDTTSDANAVETGGELFGFRAIASPEDDEDYIVTRVY